LSSLHFLKQFFFNFSDLVDWRLESCRRIVSREEKSESKRNKKNIFQNREFLLFCAVKRLQNQNLNILGCSTNFFLFIYYIKVILIGLDNDLSLFMVARKFQKASVGKELKLSFLNKWIQHKCLIDFPFSIDIICLYYLFTVFVYLVVNARFKNLHFNFESEKKLCSNCFIQLYVIGGLNYSFLTNLKILKKKQSK